MRHVKQNWHFLYFRDRLTISFVVCARLLFSCPTSSSPSSSTRASPLDNRAFTKDSDFGKPHRSNCLAMYSSIAKLESLQSFKGTKIGVLAMMSLQANIAKYFKNVVFPAPGRPRMNRFAPVLAISKAEVVLDLLCSHSHLSGESRCHRRTLIRPTCDQRRSSRCR